VPRAFYIKVPHAVEGLAWPALAALTNRYCIQGLLVVM
jgi:hypothetical protein